MNLFVPTCLALLVILAGMHYMAKVKAENLGPFFKWIGYLVLIAAACVLFGLMYKGVKKMTRHGRGHVKEIIHMKHAGPGGKAKMRNHGKSMDCGGMDEAGCGAGMEHGNCNCCCDMDMLSDDLSDSHMRSESTTDTVDGKIIRKEIKIIENAE